MAWDFWFFVDRSLSKGAKPVPDEASRCGDVDADAADALESTADGGFSA